MAEKVVAIKIDVQGTSDQNKKLAQFEKGLAELTQERKKLNAEVKKAGKITDDQAKRRAKLNTQIKATRTELNKTRNAIIGTSGFTQKLGNQFNKLGKSISGAFVGLFAIQQLTRLVGDAFETMKEFEQQMANVQAISGATEKEFKALEQSALELGKTTRQTAIEVAQLQEEYAKLGFEVPEILAATEATIQLAEATGSDLAQSAVVAASTINSFGLDAVETQRIVDVMAKSFSSSALDIDKFQTAMSNVGPVAKEAGFSIEETTGFLGVLVDNGIQASRAGTGLRNVFLTLAKTGLSLEEAMDAINNSTDKAATATELFGKENAVVATTIANNTEQIDKLTVKLDGAAGSASDMAEVVGDTLAGDVDRLTSAWDGFILSLGDSDGFLNTTARAFLGFFTELLTNLSRIEDIYSGLAEQQDRLAAQQKADQKTISDARNKEIEETKELVKLLQEQGGTAEEVNKRVNDSLDARRKVLELVVQQETRAKDALGKRFDASLEDLQAQKTALEVAEARLQSFDREAQSTRERIALNKEQSELEKTLNNIRTVSTKKLQELAKVGVEEAKAELERRKAVEKSIKAKQKAEKKAAEEKVKNEESLIKELEKLQNQFDVNEIKDEQKKQEALTNIQYQAQKDRINQTVADENLKTELLKQLETNRQQEIKKIGDDFAAKKSEEDKVKKEQTEADEKAKTAFIVGQAAEVANTLTGLIEERTNREKDIELANLNAQLEQGLITQEQFEARKLAIEKKAFEKKKKLELANIAIALATEIANINAAAAGNPTNAFTFGGAGISQAAVLTGVAIAKSAVQAGLVASQKFEDGGVLSGPSHANGGIPFSVGGVGGFEAEGGEAIINKRSTAMFAPLLSAINQAGGGVAFARPHAPTTMFANGGVTSGAAAMDLDDLETRVSKAVIASIGAIPVVNNATDTVTQASRVVNIQAEATFG